MRLGVARPQGKRGQGQRCSRGTANTREVAKSRAGKSGLGLDVPARIRIAEGRPSVILRARSHARADGSIP